MQESNLLSDLTLSFEIHVPHVSPRSGMVSFKLVVFLQVSWWATNGAAYSPWYRFPVSLISTADINISSMLIHSVRSIVDGTGNTPTHAMVPGGDSLVARRLGLSKWEYLIHPRQNG